MMYPCQFSVRFINLWGGRILTDAQHFACLRYTCAFHVLHPSDDREFLGLELQLAVRMNYVHNNQPYLDEFYSVRFYEVACKFTY